MTENGTDGQVFYLDRDGQSLKYMGLPWGTSEENLAWFLQWALHREGDVGWAVKAYHKEDDPHDLIVVDQRYPEWRDSKLGYDWAAADSTIGNWGCVVCSIAMMIQTVRGTFISPVQVNADLVEVEAFGGDTGNLVIWSRVARAYPEVKMDDWVVCDKVPAPVERMSEYLDAGNFVIFQVDINPASVSVQGHYMLLTDMTDDLQVGRAGDPWTGRIVTVPPAYTNPVWTPNNLARGVFKVAFYSEA